MGLGHERDFSVVIELSGFVSRHGSLCRDMVLKLQALLGSDMSFLGRDRVIFLLFFCRDSVLFYVMTMSR